MQHEKWRMKFGNSLITGLSVFLLVFILSGTNVNAVETNVENYGDYCNLARLGDVEITASHEPSGGGAGMARPLTKAIDGNTSADEYTDPNSNAGGPTWVQLDLGDLQKIEKIKLYRYYSDSRRYHNTVILLSPDEDFSPENTLVIWNANNETAGRGDAVVDSWEGNGNGSTGTHTLPIGDDGIYDESSSGKEFPVYGSNVKWLDGTMDGVPTENDNHFKARYVRVYMNGNTNPSGVSVSNHLVELEVYGEPNLRYSENLAEGATVSTKGTDGISENLERVTDGDKRSQEGTYANLPASQAWIQLDLGIKHHINNVALWRFAGRSYYNTVVMISPDENFDQNTTLVLWNGNGANGGKDGQKVDSWPGDGNGQIGVETHRLPTGTDATYIETSAGKVFKVTASNVKWLNGSAENLPEETYEARYVRVYMNGSTSNHYNHAVEIEVHGIRAEAPTKVTGIVATEIGTTSAVINFSESTDGDGNVAGYKLSVCKQGEAATVYDLDGTNYTLTDLEPNTTYEVTVVAVDDSDNESEVSDTYTFKTLEIMSVSVEATEGGTVTGATEVGKGTEVTVQATAIPGYRFGGWYNSLGTQVSEDAEYIFAVNENTALVAKFVIENMGPDGDGAEVLGYSLSLEGNIGVNFYLQLSEELLTYKDTAYLNITLNGKEHSKVYIKDAVEGKTDDEESCHIFTCGVPVKDMDSTIKVQMILPDDRKGPEHTYTIKKYVDTILKNEGGKYDAATITLVEKMRDFGDFAETYFEKGSNGELSNEMLGVTATTLADFKVTRPTNNIYYGSSLLLRTDTVLRHYFKEEVKVVKVGGNAVAEDDETYKAVPKGNLYYVDYAGIAAHELATNIEITVVSVETDEEFTITYSPLSYAYIVLAQDDSDENLENLMRAMYLYYDAAQKYPR